jgi:hypothetical protein
MSEDKRDKALPSPEQVAKWGIDSDEYRDWLKNNPWFVKKACLVIYPKSTAIRNADVTIAHLSKYDTDEVDSDIALRLNIAPARIRQISMKSYRKIYFYLKHQVEPNRPREGKLQSDLTDLNLSCLVHNALKRERINTIGQLCSKTPNDLLELNYIGTFGLEEIKEKLSKINRSLKEDDINNWHIKVKPLINKIKRIVPQEKLEEVELFERFLLK